MFRFLAIFFFTLSAHANFSADFAESFQRQLFWFEPTRLLDTSARIRLARPSLLERWGVINNEAAATYNSFLNTIVLKPEATGRDGAGRLRIATIPELMGTGPSYSVDISIIFHEIAHAEYDVLVEKGVTPEDERLYRAMQQEILPWIARNHPELSRLSQNIALWEIFGYYRGDLMQLLLSDRDDILSANGFFNGRCYFPSSLKAKAAELSLEEFMKLLPVGTDYAVSYGKRFRLDLVWALGNEVELHWRRHADPFRDEWQLALFRHFRAFYAIPETKGVLLQRMNRLLPKAFLECRRAYWEQLRR